MTEFRENRPYGEFFGVGLLYGTIDPTIPPGIPALPGQIYCRNNNDRGELWLKDDIGDTHWVLVTTRAPGPG